MDFNHSEDRRMIADSLRRFLADKCEIEHRNSFAYDAPYHSEDLWAGLCELGIPAALVSEDAGGFGGSGFDIAVVFEEIGRGLCPEPLLGNLLALKLYESFGKSERIEAIIAGAERAALAAFETDAFDELEYMRTEAYGAGDSVTLTGRKSVVMGGNAAHRFLVAAKNGAGIGLYEVEAKDAEVMSYALIEGGGAAELILDKSPAILVAERAETELEAALDAGRVALCAEAVGIMDVLSATVKDYLVQRQQFGRPIATFQALQHRLVDFNIEIEQSRSITILAADRLDKDDRALNVARAKNLIGRAGKLVAEETIQMHGGIGMTWEYGASHFAKRLIMIDHHLGDTEDQLRRVMELEAA